MKTAITLVGVWLAVASGVVLWGQNPVKAVDGNGAEISFGAGGTKFDSGIVTIAVSSGTALSTVTTRVQLIHCNTISSTSSTVTIKDGNGVVKGDTLALAANGVLVIQYGSVGLPFASGVTIVAGTASVLNCQVIGVK